MKKPLCGYHRGENPSSHCGKSPLQFRHVPGKQRLTKHGAPMQMQRRNEALLYVPSDTPEALVTATRPLAGVPLIIRGIMTLAQSGIKGITLLVAPSQQKKIETFLQRYRTTPLPSLTILSYDEPYRMSPKLLNDMVESLDQRFFVINSNFLFDLHLLNSFHGLEVRGHEIMHCQEGVHPLPFFRLTRSGLNTLLSFTTEKPRSIESCLTHLLSTLSCHVVQKPKKADSFLVMKPEDRPIAEKFLTESIRRATNGIVARWINKRFSLPVSLLLSKIWVSPNTITVINMCIGLLSGVFIAHGKNYASILLGASLFQLASIADGCDGEVAKLTFRTSRFGQYIDTISDNASLLSLLVGLIFGYWQYTGSSIAFIVGGTTLLATITIILFQLYTLRKFTTSKSLAIYHKEFLPRIMIHQPRWLGTFIQLGKFVVMKDFFSLAIFLFALFGIIYWWLYIALVASLVGVLITGYLAFSQVMPQALTSQVSFRKTSPSTLTTTL